MFEISQQSFLFNFVIFTLLLPIIATSCRFVVFVLGYFYHFNIDDYNYQVLLPCLVYNTSWKIKLMTCIMLIKIVS